MDGSHLGDQTPEGRQEEEVFMGEVAGEAKAMETEGAGEATKEEKATRQDAPHHQSAAATATDMDIQRATRNAQQDSSSRQEEKEVRRKAKRTRT